ncbi:proline-rich receptor-like protein kinase PERK9 [Coregonus clupeaformis]|uniref:proline-rich receptor-like protein kinase PERK9 n=1 Tax=Coregonus clupeaformis TaxID=59861 RepID=UPI001E1C85F0|nr:proline-rich receptor-like protein kinase PERK9 [Coregonus clupeaformis]XP_045081762.1 proline-rich receptor-like protein kinase PERK9 [Coregonus clupeaformis]
MFKTLYALGVTSSINVARAAAERLQSGRIMEESGEDEDEDSSCGSEESLSASEESHSSSPIHSLAWTNPTPQLHREVLVSFPFSFPIPLQVWFPQALFPFPPPAFSTPLQKLPQALLPLSLPFPPLAFLAPFPHTVCVGATAIPPTATGTSATGVWRAEWNQTEEGDEQFPPPLNHQTQTRSQPQPPQPDTDQTPTPNPETSSPQPPQPDTDPTPGPPLTNQSQTAPRHMTFCI